MLETPLFAGYMRFFFIIFFSLSKYENLECSGIVQFLTTDPAALNICTTQELEFGPTYPMVTGVSDLDAFTSFTEVGVSMIHGKNFLVETTEKNGSLHF